MTPEDRKIIISRIKKIIRADDNLQSQIKPGTNNQESIIFRALPENHKYDQQLQFWLGGASGGKKNNIFIKIWFQGNGDYKGKEIDTKIKIDIGIKNINDAINEPDLKAEIANGLDTMREKLRTLLRCPAEYGTQLGIVEEAETAPKENKEDNVNKKAEENECLALEPWLNPEVNPWKNITWTVPPFILNDVDNEKVTSYNAELNRRINAAGKTDKKQELEQYRIHLDVPPQPYIGNPAQAKIWLLTINPSYSAIDIFDLKNEEDGRTEINNDGDCRNSDVKIITSGRLQDRMDLINAQNSFEFQNLLDGRYDTPQFYVLDESFHTISHTGDKRLGSYDWWKFYLLDPQNSICQNSKKNLQNFFVLESFPYHSKHFEKAPLFFKNTVSQVCHYSFWQEMVRYALKNDKILLCRSQKIADRVAGLAGDGEDGEKAKKERIFIGLSSGCFPVTTDNFISYQTAKEIEEAITRMTDSAKSYFRSLVTP